eukprot:gene25600-11252_t
MPISGLPFSDADIFPFLNVILPAWALLMILPGSKITHAVVKFVALGLSILYVALLANSLAKPGSEFSLSDFASLKGITELFKQKDAILPCWVHFCAFDLWSGFWIATDGVKRRVPRIIMAPIIFVTMLFDGFALGKRRSSRTILVAIRFVTMLFGPAGLLSHFFISSFWTIKLKTA